MARRNNQKPAPVPLKVGGKTLATAYARKAPGKRRGAEHWSWEVHYTTPSGDRRTQSLGRVETHLVGIELARFFQGVNPAAVKSDGTGVTTVGGLIRAYYAHLEGRSRTPDALAERTLMSYEGNAKRLLHVADSTPLSDVSETWVLAIRDTLLRSQRDNPKQGYAPRTIKADLKFVRQAVLWGRKRGVEVIDLSVTDAMKFKGNRAKVPVNNHRTPSEVEVEILYTSMKTSGTKLALMIMWKTGCRVGEASLLRWCDLLRGDGGAWVDFPDGKTGARKTPITEEALQEILSYRPGDATDEDRLFRKPAQVAKNTGAAIAEACKVGGRNIEPFTSHGLRRLFTDRCMRSGVDVGTYADIAGHSVETALRDYRGVTDDDRLAALHRLRSRPQKNVLSWLVRNNITEDEAIRVLSAWRSESVGLGERDAGGGESTVSADTTRSPNGIDKVPSDDPTAATTVTANMVH